LAILDRERGQIVVCIAYDGPALSGKTTSVRALSRSLGRSVFSAGEAEGRTLFFDWMDYAAGRFEGYEIRCQVISVPGQPVLTKRRRKLLALADAIVFVADATASGIGESLRMLRSLEKSLAAGTEPRPGVIIQANKRDHPESVPIEELRARLNKRESMAITESVASQGVGVRETFIFAVRLALDRVRDLIETKSLNVGTPQVDSGEQLFEDLAKIENAHRASSSDAEIPLDHSLATDLAAVFTDQLAARTSAANSDRLSCNADVAKPPQIPDASVSSGLVWPPVDGRVILHQVSAAAFEPERSPAGDWLDERHEVWRLHSASSDHFDDLEKGRETLVKWARTHTVAAVNLSPHRCIVLAQSAPGEWRLWQIVKRMRSLHDLLSRAASNRAPAKVAALLLETSRLVVEAATRFDREVHAKSVIDSVTPIKTTVMFSGFMPSPLNEQPRPVKLPRRSLIRKELASAISQILENRSDEVEAVIDHLRLLGRASSDVREDANTLSAMLLEQ